MKDLSVERISWIATADAEISVFRVSRYDDMDEIKRYIKRKLIKMLVLDERDLLAKKAKYSA